jgi:regulator of protease activity HflC (stomatin/prohibitin superfamily)
MAYSRFPNQMPPFLNGLLQNKFKLVAAIILVLFLLSAFSNSVLVVPAGHRAVVFNTFTGVERASLTEGMHLLVPFVETPIIYDVRTQTYTMSAAYHEGDQQGDDAVVVLTSDGQIAKMDLSVRFHLIPSEVWKVHQEVGPTFIDKIIRPESRTVARNVVSGFTVTELYSTKRQAIQADLEQQMSKTFGKYFIALDGVLIRNVSFSEAFASAIEQKQVALQEAERMKYVLQKEEAEKQRKIIEATGEAEAIRRRAEALRQNPQLIQYEYVQKLTPGIKGIITDQKTILNMSDFLRDGKN